MFMLFKKNKIKETVHENCAHGKNTINIVSVFIRFQRKWAKLMQVYTERLSRQSKLMMFFLFCIIGGSLSIYLIANSIIGREKVSYTVTHFKRPQFVDKTGDENTKIGVRITESEYQKIQLFKLYMDSLVCSPSGKKIYDNILKSRSGLIDSIFIIDKIYRSQNKK
ncbi:MAG: hypothetical protein ABI168_10095 [Ginsengibacter sp.]